MVAKKSVMSLENLINEMTDIQQSHTTNVRHRIQSNAKNENRIDDVVEHTAPSRSFFVTQNALQSTVLQPPHTERRYHHRHDEFLLEHGLHV